MRVKCVVLLNPYSDRGQSSSKGKRKHGAGKKDDSGFKHEGRLVGAGVGAVAGPPRGGGGGGGERSAR